MLHYMKCKNVAIIDCDYPQHSLLAMRDRDKEIVSNQPEYQQQLVKQFDRINKKSYPVLKAMPKNCLHIANSQLVESSIFYDVIFFDFPGTMANEGVLNSIMGMDYIFVPIITDKIVMQSSLQFAVAVENYKRMHPDVRLKGIYHFWNKVDKRENTEVYDMYNDIIERLHINILNTQIPDSKKFKRELSFENRPVFRSTLFPPDKKLLKGSNMEGLIKEICTIINLD
ncbi:MAG: ParA family protein [Clostridium sp.]|nr:ParA family protein [Clostridium sp.]